MSGLSLKYFCVCSHAHVADLMAPTKQTGYHIQYVSDWVLCFSKCVFFIIFFMKSELQSIKMHTNALLCLVSFISDIFYLI